MVTISRFLPNPAGSDTAGEWIEIANNGTERAVLAGWRIADHGGKVFYLKGVLESKAVIHLPYETTRISLNNGGETLYLFNPEGEVVDTLSFSGDAAEGYIVEHVQQNAALAGLPIDANVRAEVSYGTMLLTGFGVALTLSVITFFLLKQLSSFLKSNTS